MRHLKAAQDSGEEFVTISHQVAFDDVTLMDGFWCGLDEDIHFLMPRGSSCWSFAEYVNFALWVDGFSFEVGEAEEEDNSTSVQPDPTSTATSPIPVPSQPSHTHTRKYSQSPP